MRKIWQGLLMLILCLGVVFTLQTANVVLASDVTLGDSKETAEKITVGDVGQVTIENSEDEKWFQFTAPEDGIYVFQSELTSVHENPVSINCLYYDDYTSSEGLETVAYKQLTAGQTSYFQLSAIGDGEISFSFKIKKNTWNVKPAEESYTVEPGGEVELSVSVDGVDPSFTYSWYDNQGYVMEGKDTNTVTVKPVSSGWYHCDVSDGIITLTAQMYVSIENHLAAYAGDTEETSTNITVNAGESATLNVAATCTEGQLTYAWSKWTGTEYSGEWEAMECTESSLTVTGNSNAQYMCCVTDQYGNKADVYFTIYIENNLTAYAGDTEETSTNITVNAGESATLNVTANCSDGELTYCWYRSVYNDELEYYENEEELEEAENSITVTESILTQYRCRVTDKYGNEADVCFNIYIENNLTAYAGDTEETSTNITVNAGESATLNVTANCSDGELTYCWYRSVYNDELEYYENEEELEEAENSITVTESIPTLYRCNVNDQYGNWTDVYFYIQIDNGLFAYVKGTEKTDQSLEVFRDDEVTLSVDAGCNQGAETLTYHWQERKYNSENGEWEENDLESTDSSISFIATDDADYYCTVTDSYNNVTTVYFYVSLVGNDLYLSSEDSELCVEAGSAVTLKADCEFKRGSVSYQWKDEHDAIVKKGTLSAPGGELSLDVDTVPVPVTYILYAEDEYGNTDSIEFHIALENGFTAHAEQEDIEVAVGEPVTLKVIAVCTQGEIHYKWYHEIWDEDDDDYEPISGVEGNEYTFTAEEDGSYYVLVTDDFGNSQEVWFDVNTYGVLELQKDPSSYDEEEESVQLGDTLKFAVIAKSNSSGDPEYKWFKSKATQNEDGYWNIYDTETEITGATGNSVTVKAEYGSWKYRCVANKNGQEDEIEFYYSLSDLKIDYQEEYTAKAGETILLKVDANTSYGTLNCSWYEADVEDGWIDSGTEIKITVKEGTTRYKCYVEDAFNSKFVFITVIGTTQENAEAVNDATDKINNLSPADKLTLADKSAVEAARKAYDALTADQKKLVSSNTLDKLTAAENKISNLETAADNQKKADEVTKAINTLKSADSVTTADKAAVQAARKAYDALTADQKKLVSSNTLDKLTAAENKINDLEKAAANNINNSNNNNNNTNNNNNSNNNGSNSPAAADKTAADSAASSMNALKSADAVTLADKAAVQAARAAYDKLTDAQKKLVPAETLKKLTDAEGKIAALEKDAANAVQAGKVYTVSDMNYKVTNADMKGEGTVTLTGTKMKKTKLKRLNVPAAVQINGASFKVTAIGNNAFRKFKKLKAVTIGANVASIGKNAFAGDTALTKVTIGKGVTKIGKAAFSGDKKLKNIIIKSAKLKSVGKSAIKGIQKKAAIKVPKKQLKKYKKLFKASTGFKKTMKIKK